MNHLLPENAGFDNMTADWAQLWILLAMYAPEVVSRGERLRKLQTGL